MFSSKWADAFNIRGDEITVQSENFRTRHGIDLLMCSLPVSEPRRLLKSLAAAWAQACDCSSLFVSVIVHREAVGLFLRDGRADFTTSECDGEWTAGQATEWMSPLLDDCRELLISMTVVPFEFHNDSLVTRHESPSSGSPESEKPVEAVGGVLVLGAEPDLRTVRPLADLSARLIRQLRLNLARNDDEEHSRKLRDLKLEALAEFAAGAGHEINNPVATIAGRASLLLRGEADPERRRALETIGGQAYRIRDMIGDAMTFARPPESQVETVSPAQLVNDVLASFEEAAQRQGTAIEASLDQSLRISADAEQFRVVVSCLIRNSLEALTTGGSIRLSLRADGNSQVMLRVSDNGPGLGEIEREHLFDPFFSGRQAGRGLGFGLSRCWQILRQHGGWIDTEDCESGFAITAAWPQHG